MKISAKLATILIAAVFFTFSAEAQKYITKNGVISFYSETPIETIQAENEQVNAAMDTQSGDIVFKVLIKSFKFPKALMEEHFNENYLESDKYPNSIFKGKITNLDAIDFSKQGTYNANIEGELTIHNITNKILTTGTFTVNSGDKIHGHSKFDVKPEDYKIKIPNTVVNNIAEIIQITVSIEMARM